MSVPMDTMGVEGFRQAVTRRLGLQIEDHRLPQLAGLLDRRLTMTKLTASDYLAGFGEDPDELQAVAAELTINETYFFRHAGQFRALAEVALPKRLRSLPAPRRLRVLSAGCSTGEEAYSLAMTLRRCPEAMALGAPAIIGIDIDRAALAQARRGHYSSWSLREPLPDLYQPQWLRSDGATLCLDDTIRHMVTFVEGNLADDGYGFGGPETFDIVFCRNLLIHFSPDHARRLLERLAERVSPGGFLFLGHAEVLRDHDHDFVAHQSHEAFYFERTNQSDRAAEIVPPSEPKAAAGRSRHDKGEAARGQPTMAAPNLRDVLDLFRDERFSEALDWCHRVPPPASGMPLLRLVQAVAYAQLGETAVAASLAIDLIDRGESAAGAHFLLALCHESGGRPQLVADHHRAAIGLDPAFALPYLHLGRQARQAGRRDEAVRHYRQALMRLPDEDATRLLLFGGGFGREALQALCRSELMALGVAS